jgi:hypothetical protein
MRVKEKMKYMDGVRKKTDHVDAFCRNGEDIGGNSVLRGC